LKKHTTEQISEELWADKKRPISKTQRRIIHDLRITAYPEKRGDPSLSGIMEGNL
jgi:hypothetical protein